VRRNCWRGAEGHTTGLAGCKYRIFFLLIRKLNYYNLNLQSAGEIPLLSIPTPLLQAFMWKRDMMTHVQYQHLEPHPSSNYRQLWVKGRHIRAEVLYRLTIGTEPRSPAEVAQDYDLLVEAVQEAIDYAVRNQELLDAERADEACRMQQLGLDKSPCRTRSTSSITGGN
jgi:uncharacterized protein (DUF433 family)